MATFWNHNEGKVVIKDTEIKQANVDTTNVTDNNYSHPIGEPKECHCSDVASFNEVFSLPWTGL